MAKNMQVSLLYDFYGDLLTEKQQEAIELYYNEDLSLAEIAQFDDITRQGVRDSIKRAEAQLFEFEERLGLYERFQNIKAALKNMNLCADEIERLNQRLHGSKEIEDKCKLIKKLSADILEQ
ncbi:MAG: YlxM family DNA-binding protein [Oscillospiraceae bacterium]